MRTLIKGGWVIAFGAHGHELLRDGEVVFENDRIAFIGRDFSGAIDRRIEAADKLVSPGFIDSHVHAGHRALHRLLSDTGRSELLGQPFHEIALRRPGASAVDGRSAVGDLSIQATYTVAELLRNGITTFVEFGSNARVLRALASAAESLGIRAWLGAGYESHKWVSTETGRAKRIQDDAEGENELKAALSFIESLPNRADQRLQGLLVPRDADTCSPALLRRTADIMKERALRVAIHVAYNPREFYDVVAEHGCTPIELLERAGLLNDRAILGHCNFLAYDGRMNYPAGRDLELLASSGATVSHCPVNLVRRGRVLDSWSAYRRAGIPIALGTDTYPRDMIMQMRVASYMAKMVTRDLFAAPAEEVFDAATLAGSHMLGRDDIGRLAPGAKADIIIVDLAGRDTLRLGPLRDPVRTLVECGIGDDVETVIVDGRVCVENRQVLGVNIDQLRAAAQAEGESLWASVKDWDPLGRSVEERSPWSFPLRQA